MKYKLYVEYYLIAGSSKVVQGMTGTGTRRFATLAMLDVYLDDLVYCPPNKSMHVMYYEIWELIHED